MNNNNNNNNNPTISLIGVHNLINKHSYSDDFEKYTYITDKEVINPPRSVNSNPDSYYKFTDVYVKNTKDEYFFFALIALYNGENSYIWITDDRGKPVVNLYSDVNDSIKLEPCLKEHVGVYPTDSFDKSDGEQKD